MKEVGWGGGENDKGWKTKKGYKKQIAKHKHQSVDRSRNRKLDSQELENASMREKIVSMNHCVSPATVGGRKEGKDKLQINETEKETKRDEEDAGGKESEMEEMLRGLFPALSDTTGASVLASQNSLHHRLSPSPPESPHQHETQLSIQIYPQKISPWPLKMKRDKRVIRTLKKSKKK